MLTLPPREAALVVPVRPPAEPVATGAPLSTSSELMYPVPEPSSD